MWRQFRLRNSIVTMFASLIALGLAIAPSAAAAPLHVREAGGATFPQRVLLVSGRGIPSLSARRVHIVENGVPVRALTIRSLKQPSGNDFGVVLTIDISPSASAIEHAAAAALVIASQRPAAQQLGIVEADATPPVALGMTRDSAAIRRALATPPTIARHGETIYEAALSAVELLAGAKIGAGSVIVLSDGADQGTAGTLDQLVAAAASAHVRIFSVGIRSARFNPTALMRMADLTGGQFYEAQSSQLRQIFDDIESNLESEYLVRYYSPQGPGKQVAASIRIDGVPGAYDISYASPAQALRTFRHARPTPSFWTSRLALLAVPFVCALLLLVGAMVLFLRRRAAVRDRVGSFLVEPDPSITPDELAGGSASNRLFDQTQQALQGLRWWEGFQEEVEIAQIKPSPVEVVFLALAAALVTATIITALTESVVAGVLTAVVVPVLARLVIRHRVRHQQKLFAEQLGEHLQEVAGAMRAGRSLVDAFAVVTESASQPTRREFELALADERLGMSFDQALTPIARRMANRDMLQVALVAALDRRTGASTSEVIERIAEGVRESTELRRELRALTAQMSLSRWILTGLPIAVLLAISLTDPAYERPMYHTTLGVVLLILCAIMIIAGSLVMSRLVRMET